MFHLIYSRLLFDAALDDVAGGGLINEALEVGIIDGEIQITRYDLPTLSHGGARVGPHGVKAEGISRPPIFYT